jgi:hypothetical protein
MGTGRNFSKWGVRKSANMHIFKLSETIFTDFLGMFRIEEYSLPKIILTFDINIWYISYFTVLISFLAL